jgi:hypothetical protein
MADSKISALGSLLGANVAAGDLFPIVDISAGIAGSKNIAASELVAYLGGSFSALGHVHTIANVTGLQTTLDGKATPADITAAISAVVGAAPVGLDTLVELASALGNDASYSATMTLALADKSNVGHAHIIGDVTGLQTALDGKAALTHAHIVSDVTGLQAALDAKMDDSQATAFGLSLLGAADAAAAGTVLTLGTAAYSAVGAFAAAVHSHAVVDGANNGFMSIADKTKLDGIATGANLYVHPNHSGEVTSVADGAMTIAANAVTNAKAAQMATATIKGRTTAGTGNAEDLTVAQVNAMLPVFTSALNGLAPLSGGGTTKYLRADGTWVVPSGGADPWTYVVLGADFTTSSGTSVDVTGMNFTPGANKRYEIEVWLMTRTALATSGPRPGLTFPTGLNDGIFYGTATVAASTQVITNDDAIGEAVINSTGLPDATASYPCRINAIILTGAAPSGNVQVRIKAETATNNIIVRAGSFLKYREY